MKKIFLLFTCCLIAITMQAQNKHLKFMGIPLNGTITQFQSKLVTKGLTPYNELNKMLPVGGRAFEGTFAGEKATIHTYYNAKTKIVYRAKAVIVSSNREDIENKLKKYKNLLIEKYLFSEGEDYEQEGRPAFILYVLDDDEDYLGVISLYTTYHDYEYALHIDYEDDTNSDSNKSKNMDDL